MIEMLPCPFCGETPNRQSIILDENQGMKWGSVVCECGARGPEVRTHRKVDGSEKWHDTAIKEWNTRKLKKKLSGHFVPAGYKHFPF